jgi:transketolase
MDNQDSKSRILEISYKHKISHISSNLTAVDIIEEIFQKKKREEKFILSQGHAGLALYVVLEKHLGIDAEAYFLKCGVHPHRIIKVNENQAFQTIDYIDCSTGSLGHGLPIAVGMAIADPKSNVYCLISDGECFEGSIWESFNIIEEQKVHNLHIYVNCNGYTGYDEVNLSWLKNKLRAHKSIKFEFRDTGNIYQDFPFLKGVRGHYYVMQSDDYYQYLGKS